MGKEEFDKLMAMYDKVNAMVGQAMKVVEHGRDLMQMILDEAESVMKTDVMTMLDVLKTTNNVEEEVAEGG